MPHSAYIRVVPDSACAVLLLHGIMGTPRQFDPILDCFPADWSVYNLTLDGHGGTVADFARTDMQRWQAQADLALDALRKRHRHIVVVGHSMGCLLLLTSLLRDDSCVCGALLLAPALRIRLLPAACINSLRVALGCVPPQNVRAAAAQKACGVAPEKRLWRYLPAAPRFLELFSQMDKVRKMLNQLQAPAEAYQSRKDEMVSNRSAQLLRKNPCIRVNELPNSGHYYYEKSDLSLLTDAFSAFIS